MLLAFHLLAWVLSSQASRRIVRPKDVRRWIVLYCRKGVTGLRPAQTMCVPSGAATSWCRVSSHPSAELAKLL